MKRAISLAIRGVLLGAVLTGSVPAGADPACDGLPTHAELRGAWAAAVAAEASGLNNHMWATIVNRDGIVCAVAFSGADRSSQWPGSRVISAQKANTGSAFSLDSGLFQQWLRTGDGACPIHGQPLLGRPARGQPLRAAAQQPGGHR